MTARINAGPVKTDRAGTKTVKAAEIIMKGVKYGDREISDSIPGESVMVLICE